MRAFGYLTASRPVTAGAHQPSNRLISEPRSAITLPVSFFLLSWIIRTVNEPSPMASRAQPAMLTAKQARFVDEEGHLEGRRRLTRPPAICGSFSSGRTHCKGSRRAFQDKCWLRPAGTSDDQPGFASVSSVSAEGMGTGCCACIQSAACCALPAAVKIARGSAAMTWSQEAM